MPRTLTSDTSMSRPEVELDAAPADAPHVARFIGHDPNPYEQDVVKAAILARRQAEADALLTMPGRR